MNQKFTQFTQLIILTPQNLMIRLQQDTSQDGGYLVRSTEHKAPCYVVFSTPPVTSSLLGPNILLSTLSEL
jgi:hypothetical protein